MVRTVRMLRPNRVRAEKEFWRRKGVKAIPLATVNVSQGSLDQDISAIFAAV